MHKRSSGHRADWPADMRQRQKCPHCRSTPASARTARCIHACARERQSSSGSSSASRSHRRGELSERTQHVRTSMLAARESAAVWRHEAHSSLLARGAALARRVRYHTSTNTHQTQRCNQAKRITNCCAASVADGGVEAVMAGFNGSGQYQPGARRRASPRRWPPGSACLATSAPRESGCSSASPSASLA